VWNKSVYLQTLSVTAPFRRKQYFFGRELSVFVGDSYELIYITMPSTTPAEPEDCISCAVLGTTIFSGIGIYQLITPPLIPSAKVFQKSVGVALILTGLAYGVYNYNRIYKIYHKDNHNQKAV